MKTRVNIHVDKKNVYYLRTHIDVGRHDEKIAVNGTLFGEQKYPLVSFTSHIDT